MYLKYLQSTLGGRLEARKCRVPLQLARLCVDLSTDLNEPRLVESFSLLLLALQLQHLESFAILLTLPSHLIPKASLARCTYKDHPPVLQPSPTATGPSNFNSPSPQSKGLAGCAVI